MHDTVYSMLCFLNLYIGKNSSIEVRLSSSSLDFIGRVEVLNNGTWGTVCSDFFGISEGDVMCKALGFERAMCDLDPFYFSTPPGTGKK